MIIRGTLMSSAPLVIFSMTSHDVRRCTTCKRQRTDGRTLFVSVCLFVPRGQLSSVNFCRLYYDSYFILLYLYNYLCLCVPSLLACTLSHMGANVNLVPFVIKCLITYM